MIGVVDDPTLSKEVKERVKLILIGLGDIIWLKEELI